MSNDDEGPILDRRSRRHVEPPPGLDPKLARFIEELARAAVRRDGRTAASIQRTDASVIPPDQPSDRSERSQLDQADLDKHLRNSATREQAKQRRLNSDEPVRRRQITLDQLPLFADEKSLSDAVLGRGKYTHWRAVVPLLERRGFPTIDGLMGGRYWPAVKAFFDREYNIRGASQVSAPHQPAALGAYTGRRKTVSGRVKKGNVGSSNAPEQKPSR